MKKTNLEIIEIESTCRRGLYTELLLLLGDLNTHILGCKEAGYTLVAFAWVDVGEYEEDLGFVAVCDPHFRSVKHVVITDFLGSSLQGKGV